MHPGDAAAQRLKLDDLAWVESRRGKVKARRLSRRVLPRSARGRRVARGAGW
ncbi:MAG TPA: hypothetical protein DCQ64_05360 [Candidatus Rokubacteria bacterium]|nr:hypothetical protein [Candidatus Rokubacteria bacterium]